MMSSAGKSPVPVHRILVLAVFLCLRIPAAHAQGEIPDVHIQPRAPLSPREGCSDRYLNTIRKRVDLVLVPVTVTDQMDRAVVGLDRRNFQLYEGKQPQQIKHISRDDAPVSIGVILDLSRSMAEKIERAQEAVLELLKESNPQDEFFLITFADAPRVAQDFTQTVEDMQDRLLFTPSKGRTALLDAIYLGLDKMKEAKYQRKALVIISDGGENHSRYTEREVKSRIKETDVLTYSVGVFDRKFSTREERLGPELLGEISAVTGAQSYTLENPNDLPVIAHHIGFELRNQYVLAYTPENRADDGKWRKIKVKLTLIPKRLFPLRVHAKTGYYAPLQ